MRKMRDALSNYKKIEASQAVQKYLKGLVVARKFEPVYVKMRLTNNMIFFENLDQHRRTSA